MVYQSITANTTIPSEGTSACNTTSRNTVLENLVPLPELANHSTCLFGLARKVSANALIFFMLMEVMESALMFSCNIMNTIILRKK
jgi:hypothetical protein